MTVLNRTRVIFTGLIGGPAVSTMYFLDTNTCLPSLYNFWNGVRGNMPPNVHILIDPAGDKIEDTTGELVGAWSGAPQAEIVCNGGATYAAPVGALVTWPTASILDGRRLKGRTFVVPISAGAYTNGGKLLADAVSQISAAALQLVVEQETSMVIWHRPFAGAPAVPATATKAAKPARPAHDGGHALIAIPQVFDKVVVLRSRRD